MDKTATQKLAERYLKLLDECKNEQEYQSFIENNTRLVPREFVLNHGINFSLVLRKVPFGSDYCCDFMFLTKSTMQWQCVLIEIEKPQSHYFKHSKSQFHQDFTTACEQINTWKAWFNEPQNKSYFANNIIGLMRNPGRNNPVEIKYVLVHGRRREIEANAQRVGLIRARQDQDFRIMSFDSLAEGLASKSKLYLGAKRNDHIEILSRKFVSDNIFAWMPPEALKINKFLRAEIEAQPGFGHVFVDGEETTALQKYLDATARS